MLAENFWGTEAGLGLALALSFLALFALGWMLFGTAARAKADRGLAEGDEALMENETGSLRLHVTLSDVVPRGVAYSPKGRWPKREPGRANVNALNPGESADMGQSTSVHGVEVSVARG